MPVGFYWCHSEGCPNFGRARRMEASNTNCPVCGERMKLAAPSEEGEK